MRRSTVLVAALALAALVATIGAQALAEPGRGGQAVGPRAVAYVEGKERHCVATVGGTRAQRSAAPQCYRTFREAIWVATDGRVKNAPNDASQVAKDKELRDRLFAAPLQPRLVIGNNTVGSGTILSVEYEDTYQRGNTLTIKSRRGPCDANPDRDEDYPYVGDKWNDEISSFVGANGCQVRHWDNVNYGGANFSQRNQSDRMGSMNDRTSSITWS
jgi:hypothetical protein